MTEVLPQVDPQVVAALIMLAVTEADLARETLRRRRERNRQEILLALVDALRAQTRAHATTTSPPNPSPHEDARQAATSESTP